MNNNYRCPLILPTGYLPPPNLTMQRCSVCGDNIRHHDAYIVLREGRAHFCCAVEKIDKR